jgi:hypothetical protein
MLNDLYCSLRDNIAKLFSSSRHTAASFADELYRASTACANIVIRDNSDVSEDCRIGLTMAFLHGLLHLTDRHAFSVMPARRSEVMDHLLLLCYGQVINSISGSNITVAEKQKLLGTELDKYNEVASFYGTCKKISPEGDESPKGTFFWEFGKQFASAANHAMDIAFIAFGSGLLLDVFKHLKVSEKLSAL